MATLRLPASTQTSLAKSHQIRITDHGKIRLFVSFALKLLQEHPQTPLVFHTLPAKHSPSPREDMIPNIGAPCVANNEAENAPLMEPPVKRCKLATTTATIPRLITVVEIVKREYGKWAAARKTTDGKPAEDSLRTGLHQYNELACMEDLELADRHEQGIDNAEQLGTALEGKTFLKQKFTPHLKVTLCVYALPELDHGRATHQPPAHPPKISRSAKARQRKRRRKNHEGSE